MIDDKITRMLRTQSIQVIAPLPRTFFAQPALVVARQLLGARLVRVEGQRRLSGIITETEAYSGEDDLGCHCLAGRTPRTAVMYGPAGHAYVYFTYGMHWCLNCVVDQEGFPAAVLLRGIHPMEGLEIIAARRPEVPPSRWCDGPAKLTKALNIGQTFNGADLCDPQASLFIEPGQQIAGEDHLAGKDQLPDEQVEIGPRVGLNNVPEPWKSIPWRFRIKVDYLSTATKAPNLG